MAYSGLSTLPAMQVETDLAPVGAGASSAHYVLATNGSEYIMKGALFSPGHPYVAFNEMVAARLAEAAGLPVLDFRVLEMGGHLFFGSSWMPKPTFLPAISESVFKRCINQDIVYRLVVLDTWLCNIDRHEGNLIVRVTKPRPAAAATYSLLLNDHSHCLILPGENVSVLPGRAAVPFSLWFVRLPFILNSITDPRELKRAIDQITGLNDLELFALLRSSIPEAFITESEMQVVEQYLSTRKARLRAIFQAARSAFPKLSAGTI